MSEHHRSNDWKRILRTVKPRIAATLPAPCINGCGHDVQPGQPFDLGHITDVATATRLGWATQQINDPSNLGPAHPHCNRSAGGRAGKQQQTRNRQQQRRYPTW